MDSKPTTSILYYAIRRSFFYGVGWAFGFNMLLQDWMGLEGYIAFVRRNWVELHWGWGLILAAVCMLLYTGMLGRFHWLKEKEEDDGRTIT